MGDCCPNGQQTPRTDQKREQSQRSRAGQAKHHNSRCRRPTSTLCGNNNKLPKMFAHLRSEGEGREVLISHIPHTEAHTPLHTHSSIRSRTESGILLSHFRFIVCFQAYEGIQHGRGEGWGGRGWRVTDGRQGKGSEAIGFGSLLNWPRRLHEMSANLSINFRCKYSNIR